MNLTIIYHLSSAGQRADILAGGDGHANARILVPREAPEFPRALAYSSILPDGDATMDVRDRWDVERSNRLPDFDGHPTASDILDALDARAAALTAAEQEQQASIRESTLSALRERRTREHEQYVPGIGRHVKLFVPDWPANGPPDITTSPEARAWVEELAAANEATMAAAEAEVLARQEAERAEAEAKARARAERRASLGLRDGESAYSVEDGALTSVPIHESHRRGKNWMAVIRAVDPTKPGGLDRVFVDAARGDSYYILPALPPGTAVEFGADYVSGRGNKTRDRWYGYVVRIRPEDEDFHAMLVLHKCSTGKAAFKEGREFAQSPAATP